MNGIPPVPPSSTPETADPRRGGGAVSRASIVKAYGAPWNALATLVAANPAAPQAPGTSLRLSPIGLLIASLQAEHAGEPAVIRSPLALLRRGEPPVTHSLQTRLRASIEESGLFYESHLKRWFHKEFPAALLRREPQMRLAHSDAGASDHARRALETERDLRSSELLRPMVRHQLELLAAPVLRWEGEFWSGIYMSLLIQLPAYEHEPGDAEREGGEEQPPAAQWQVELSLDIAALGLLRARLALRGERLSLILLADAPALLERLHAHRGTLAGRLHASGFQTDLYILPLGESDAAAK